MSESSYRLRLRRHRTTAHASTSDQHASEADDEQEDIAANGDSAICRVVVEFSDVYAEPSNVTISPSCTKRRSSDCNDGKSFARR